MEYIESNIVGFANILEGCRKHEVDHLVYASSSSVYGANTATPYSIHQNVDHPISLMQPARNPNDLWRIHTAIFMDCLQLDDFYCLWSMGRPDMALFKFTKAILAGDPIQVFNYGKHRRDFTYIDDIVEGVICTLDPPSNCK